MSVIIVKLDNVHRDEQETLKEYLESKCWDWKEIDSERIIENDRQNIEIK
tara:strand:- start:78 stop:227 length:150 start_codon:yes stop_codon:yes gene_type:complete